MNAPVLELDCIGKSFSGVRVLEDINLCINKPGHVLGLVGENGAGKSTMMNILGGVLLRDKGDIYINGELYNPKNADDAARVGISLIHQELNLFNNMTIAENIYMNGAPGSKLGLLSYKTMNEAASGNLKKLGLELNPATKVEMLSMGMRQMVEIVKALSRDSKIVVFDEPTTSLSTKEKEHLFRIIRDLGGEGISVIYISHTLDDVLYLCDEIAIIRDGCIIDQSPRENLTKEKIISMMVGRRIDNLFPYIEKEKSKEEIFRIDGLNQNHTLRNISFSIKKGEIVGMFGLMGAGRSELVRAIYGLESVDSGKIFFKGIRVKKLIPEWWIENGMAYITENRREEGLLMSKTVKNNITIANLKNMKKRFGAVDLDKENSLSNLAIKHLGIKTFDKNKQEAGMLSGGNQQKLVIGKWLLTEPDFFIVDEPTRGVDVGAKFEIYNHLNALVREGSSVLFISSEMEEIIGVCDRCIVMSNGEISGELQRKKFSQESLLRLAIREFEL